MRYLPNRRFAWIRPESTVAGQNRFDNGEDPGRALRIAARRTRPSPFRRLLPPGSASRRRPRLAVPRPRSTGPEQPPLRGVSHDESLLHRGEIITARRHVRKREAALIVRHHAGSLHCLRWIVKLTCPRKVTATPAMGEPPTAFTTLPAKLPLADGGGGGAPWRGFRRRGSRRPDRGASGLRHGYGLGAALEGLQIVGSPGRFDWRAPRHILRRFPGERRRGNLP